MMRSLARRGALMIALVLLATLEGCASLMPVQPAPSGTASAGAPTGAAGGTGAGVTTRAPIDTLPSSEAQRVLDSIPEPIPAAERVPPPAVAAAAGAAAGAVAAGDSAADSLSASVPVPEPTAPLGDKPGSAELAAAAGGAAIASGDSLGSPGASSGAATGGASAGAAAQPVAGSGAGGAAAAKPAGPCYRLQIAAPKDRTQAESMKRAAESQLEVPFTITKSQSLYKVHTRDCLGEDAVQHLRARARASGFSGAFTTTEGAK